MRRHPSTKARVVERASLNARDDDVTCSLTCRWLADRFCQKSKVRSGQISTQLPLDDNHTTIKVMLGIYFTCHVELLRFTQPTLSILARLSLI